MAKKDSYFYAIGRRKSASARVRIQSGKGLITINDKPAQEYFAESKYLLNKLSQPFDVLDLNDKFDTSVVVNGGGHEGQAEAIRLKVDSLSRNPEYLRLRKAQVYGTRTKLLIDEFLLYVQYLRCQHL